MSTWTDLAQWDLVERLRPLLDKGSLFFDRNTGKITGNLRLMYDSPWVFIRSPEVIDCGIWHQIFFNHLGIVHSGCLNCYKVVAKPETVSDLFKLHDIMVDLDLPSKCGVDMRPYTNGRYGGYFYCDGFKNGEDTYHTVVNHIPENIPVILKRGCTEFELAKGSLDDIDCQTDDDKKWEQLINDNIEMPRWSGDQPEIVKNHIKRMWIAYAHRNGDKTAEDLNDGKPLVAPLKTYHERI